MWKNLRLNVSFLVIATLALSVACLGMKRCADCDTANCVRDGQAEGEAQALTVEDPATAGRPSRDYVGQGVRGHREAPLTKGKKQVEAAEHRHSKDVAVEREVNAAKCGFPTMLYMNLHCKFTWAS